MKRALAIALMFLAGCATTSTTKQPAYMKQQPGHIPLSQRKITAVAFTNGPVNVPPAQAQTVSVPAQVQPPPQTPAQTQTAPPRVRVLPLTARIASVNEKLRFVVVDFTNSRLPAIDEKLSVYRVGEKVAEIKVSGPYRNTTVAADIIAGEVKYGDEVKTH